MTEERVRRSYDLTTVAYDRDHGYIRPQRTVVVCTSRRSGSTLLGEALHRAGGLGCPLEYLHPGFRPGFANRWNAPALPGYLSALYRYRTDANGTLGIKVFWPDLLFVYAERYPDRSSPGYDAIADLVRELFPNPTFVQLWRRDLLRQAISDCKAFHTRRWRMFTASGVPPTPELAADDITVRINRFGTQRERWFGFFEHTGVEPVRLTYEQLLTDYAATVRQLAAELGGADPAAAAVTPRLRRQSDVDTERTAIRYLTAVCGPAARAEASALDRAPGRRRLD